MTLLPSFTQALLTVVRLEIMTLYSNQTVSGGYYHIHIAMYILHRQIGKR